MVYLIHFDEPFKHCQHYLGWAKDEKTFAARIKSHQQNRGSKLLAALNKAGIGWKVVRTWPQEDGNFERKIKNGKNAWAHCPTCKISRVKLRGAFLKHQNK